MNSMTQTHSMRLASSAPVKWIVILALLALAALFAADRLYDPERFRIREVEVHGHFSRVDGAQVKAMVERALSGNYFSLSLPAIEERIAQLPWVFSASVRRQWPDALVVDVVEVQPVAKWGASQWLHFSGGLVDRETSADSADMGAIEQGLPALSGPDDRKDEVWRAFQSWSKMFIANGLSLTQLRLDTRGLWHLELSLSALAMRRDTNTTTPQPNPVNLIVAHEDAEARIAQFVQALQHRLLEDFSAMRSVDLRYPNGFAVHWKTHSSTTE